MFYQNSVRFIRSEKYSLKILFWGLDRDTRYISQYLCRFIILYRNKSRMYYTAQPSITALSTLGSFWPLVVHMTNILNGRVSILFVPSKHTPSTVLKLLNWSTGAHSNPPPTKDGVDEEHLLIININIHCWMFDEEEISCKLVSNVYSEPLLSTSVTSNSTLKTGCWCQHSVVNYGGKILT